MKMSNNWAIAALAATATIISTVPAAAFPLAATGTPSASVARADSVNLQRGGRAGGGHAGARAGGGHAAGGQASARPTRQAGAAHNVRSTSGASINGNHDRNVNRNTNRNVNRNVNRDVNIDVDNHGGWDNDWNDHYHPIAAGVAMGATAAIVGSIVSRPPTTGCVTTVYNGISYTQCGSTWYQPQYAGTTVQYIVVNPPY